MDFDALLAALFAGLGTGVASGETSDPGGTALPVVPADRQATAESAEALHRLAQSTSGAVPHAVSAGVSITDDTDPRRLAMRDAMLVPKPDSPGIAPALSQLGPRGPGFAEPAESPADTPALARPVVDPDQRAQGGRAVGESARIAAPDPNRAPIPEPAAVASDRLGMAVVRDPSAAAAPPTGTPSSGQPGDSAAGKVTPFATGEPTSRDPAIASSAWSELSRNRGLDAQTVRAPTLPGSNADLSPADSDPAALAARVAVSPPSGAPEPVQSVLSRTSIGRAEPTARDGARARADAGVAPPTAERAAVPLDPARVRQAADLLRRWQAASASAETSAANAPDGFARHPATASAVGTGTGSSTSAGTPAAPAADGAVLALVDGREAAEQLVQRVLQGHARGMNSLSFQLSPAELGRLEIRMRRHGDRMEIAFTTTQSVARELIESSLPHLRALLQDVGIQLTDAEVRHEGAWRDGFRGASAGAGYGDGDDRRAQQDGGAPGGRTATEESTVTAAATEPQNLAGPGRIDAFV